MVKKSTIDILSSVLVKVGVNYRTSIVVGKESIYIYIAIQN